MDLSKLQKGDIILQRFPNEASRGIREKTGSEYSHAMLYMGNSSILHANLKGGVAAINAQREGVENADEKIFYGANYIIDPTEKNSEEAIENSRELATILGFKHISCLSPEEHDEIIGFVSQLTHCIAVSLMNVSDNDKLVNYVGDSFRDLTRIAKINENMWTELFISNKKALVNNIDRFMSELKDLRDCIETEDADRIKQKMLCSTERRSLFDKKQE